MYRLMKSFAYLFTLVILSIDFMLIAAIVVMFRVSPILGIIGFFMVNSAQKKRGGWFYGWRPRDIKDHHTFMNIWDHITKGK